MKLLLMRGKGAACAVIRMVTRSKYSHVALLLDDGKTIIEAWYPKGVQRRTMQSWENVDVFDVQSATVQTWSRVQEFCNACLGDGYDLSGAIASPFRLNRCSTPGKYDCSTLIATAFEFACCSLTPDITPWNVTPADIARSPLVSNLGSATTTNHEKTHAVTALRFAS